MWVFSTAASEPTAPSGDFPSDGADRGTDTAQQKITSSREEKLFLLFCVQVFFYFWCNNKTVVIWQIETCWETRTDGEKQGDEQNFTKNKPKITDTKYLVLFDCFPPQPGNPWELICDPIEGPDLQVENQLLKLTWVF